MAETAERDGALRAFYIHLAIYAVANLILMGLNLWRAPAEGEPREYWFVWPLAGWGIGVAAHGLALWLKRLGADDDSLFADKEVRGAAVHLFVYLAVNALLIVVNFVVTPNTIWFFWPLVGWGIGLAFHAWRVYRGVLKRTVEHYALEQRLIGEISLERRAAEIAASLIPGVSKPEEAEAEADEKPASGEKQPQARKRSAARKAEKPSGPASKKRAARKSSAGKGSAAKARPSKTPGRKRGGKPAS
jgi:hypothetical protein